MRRWVYGKSLRPYITQLFLVRRKVPYLLRKKLERGLEIAMKENETCLY